MLCTDLFLHFVYWNFPFIYAELKLVKLDYI